MKTRAGKEAAIIMFDSDKLNIMNTILASIYDKAGKEDIRGLFLSELRLVIPYTHASFWLHQSGSHGVITDPISVGMSQDFLDKYQFFAEKDYLPWFYSHSSSLVFCDSKIFEDSVRHPTDFYLEYLMPEKIYYGCGLILIKDSLLAGVINLFRTEKFNDFSKEELNCLEFFMPHLENIMYDYNAKLQLKESPEESFNQIFSKSMHLIMVQKNLTQREIDIIELFCRGFSAAQAAQHLGISLSTVKKHLNNIFTKCDISHKNQLFSMILDHIKIFLRS